MFSENIFKAISFYLINKMDSFDILCLKNQSQNIKKMFFF